MLDTTPGSPDGPPRKTFGELVVAILAGFTVTFAAITLATLAFTAAWWAIIWLLAHMPA